MSSQPIRFVVPIDTKHVLLPNNNSNGDGRDFQTVFNGFILRFPQYNSWSDFDIIGGSLASIIKNANFMKNYMAEFM
jgi:hypothetical protein